MSLTLVPSGDALPDVDELETLVHEILATQPLLIPRRRWSVKGMVGEPEIPALDPVLEAAPTEYLLGDMLHEAWIGFFAPGDHAWVRRQSAASLDRLVQLDGVQAPRPGQTTLRLSEPLIARDRSRLLTWANLMQYEQRDGQWRLHVHQLAELALERVDGRWIASADAPKTCRSLGALEQ